MGEERDRSERWRRLPCSAAACKERTNGGKPYCIEHYAKNVYVSALMAHMQERAEIAAAKEEATKSAERNAQERQREDRGKMPSHTHSKLFEVLECVEETA